ncbi:MAG TPA: deoxyribose-phosphate aldolase [Chitinophagaceae bacterium]|nr:deoxyribose-phosphate aldolase [Chitinophagaceae bacterium]
MQIASYIDHTILKPTSLISDVERICNEAVEYGFAAVCIPPPFVKRARIILSPSSVKVATVVGFPFGYAPIESKVAEVVLAIVDGADELDMVINLIALKNTDWEYLEREINLVKDIIKQKGKLIKVIIESGVLSDEEILKCCSLYAKCGVDFLKTSTGYADKGATVEAVQLMRRHLPSTVRIKASGGIKTYAFAKQLIEAGASRLGCSASVEILKYQDAP